MGAFYGTVYLRTHDRNRVRAALEGLGSAETQFLLAPALSGWIGVYPKDCQDAELAGRVARAAGGIALYVHVHDGDLFGYCYYRDGQVVDERWHMCVSPSAMQSR